MSTAQILALGAIAGFTIFLGLPLGRVESTDARLRAALSGLAAGILLFLLYDVLAHGVGPVEESLEEAVADGGSWPEFVGLAGLLGAGLVLGLMSLVYYDRWMKRRPAPGLVGPGAAAVAEYEARTWFERLGNGHRLALLIATGIGLHNFGEGLAIGAAFALGEAALGTLLIVGFTLHNTTEGLAILAPIAKERPSIGLLIRLGLIGGVPTIAGAWLGGFVYSRVAAVLCLGLGAGAIAQVVVQLSRQVGAASTATGGGSRSAAQRFATAPVMLGLMAGFAVMYATGMLVG